MKAKNEWEYGITRDSLLSIFEYSDGRFNRIGQKRKVGWEDKKSKYRRIQIGEHTWMEHRLVWIFHNGDIPDGITVDHKDHDVGNNKVENLRLATRSEQNKYQRKRSNCTSEFIGVYWKSNHDIYEVYVNTYDGGVKNATYIGSYSNDRKGAEERDAYIIKNDLCEWNLLNFQLE